MQVSQLAAQGSKTVLHTPAALVAVLFGKRRSSLSEPAAVTFSSPGEAADSDGLSAFTV